MPCASNYSFLYALIFKGFAPFLGFLGGVVGLAQRYVG
jgi:hypothetical protein